MEVNSTTKYSKLLQYANCFNTSGSFQLIHSQKFSGKGNCEYFEIESIEPQKTSFRSIFASAVDDFEWDTHDCMEKNLMKVQKRVSQSLRRSFSVFASVRFIRDY